MRNLEIYPLNDPRALERAFEELTRGNAIAFPTDTLYALSCDATNATATKKLYEIKQRDRKKSSPVFISSIEMAMRYAKFSRKILDITSAFWPGALTIVAPAKENTRLAPECIAVDGSIALRMPDHRFCLDLLTKFEGPIIGTSANISDLPSATSAKEVKEQLGEKIDLIIADYDVLGNSVPSTIVKMMDDGIKILRHGAISEAEVFKSLRK